MRERSNGEQDNVRALLCLVLTLLVRSDDDTMESVDGICCTGKPIVHSRSLYEVKWEGGSQYGKANTRKCKRQGKESKSVRRPYPTINLLLALGDCDSRLHPNVYRLLLIARRLPITSAEAERSLFLLRRLKTYTRSTIAEERLAHVSVIAIHYKDWVLADEFCTKSSTEIVHTVFI